MEACGHARRRRLDCLELSSFSAGARAGRRAGLEVEPRASGESTCLVRARATQYLTLHYVVPWIALSTLMSQTHTHSMPSKAWPRPRRRRPEREWTSEGNRAPRRVECMPNAWLQATSP